MKTFVARFASWLLIGALPALIWGRPTVEYQYGLIGEPSSEFHDEERVRTYSPERIRADATVRLIVFAVYETRGPEAEVRARIATARDEIWLAFAVLAGLTTAGIWLWFRVGLDASGLLRLPILSFLGAFGVHMASRQSRAKPEFTPADDGLLLGAIVASVLCGITLAIVYVSALAECLVNRRSAFARVGRLACQFVLTAYYLAGLLGLIVVGAIKVLTLS